MKLLTTAFTALTAIFTGASVYLIWKKRLPVIELFGEKVGEDEYRCKLTIRNITDSVAKIYEIHAHRPLYSTVCPMAGIRDNPNNDVRDTNRYDSSFKKLVVVNPKNECDLLFFFKNGTPSTEKMMVLLKTSWSNFPIIKKILFLLI